MRCKIRVIEFFKEHKKIANKKYANLFGMTDGITTRDDLVDKMEKERKEWFNKILSSWLRGFVFWQGGHQLKSGDETDTLRCSNQACVLSVCPS